MRQKTFCLLPVLTCVGVVISGCTSSMIKEESVRAAVGSSPIISCGNLAATDFPKLTITSASVIAAGQKEAAGNSGQKVTNPEYCKVLGQLNKRISPIDGKTYAISFEMRFPRAWNGRFFHQVNGGLDGFVTAAVGDILGGGQESSALTKGFAVLSSDAGHADLRENAISGGVFGIDPQARIDYGYHAVASLTPMAKNLIRSYYGKAPDKSYMVGTSNGGRHTMVTASRLGDQYDGYLVSAPGFNLPRAAVAQLWGAQQFASISPVGANGRPDIAKSFSVQDTRLIADKILTKCDALDGLVDHMVSDTAACQNAFDVSADIPTCSGAPDGTCLSAAQKTVLSKVFSGARDSAGRMLYTSFPWTEGIYNTSTSGWRTWKLSNSIAPRDPLAIGFVFMTPPVSPAVMTGTGTTILDFAINWNNQGFNVDRDAQKIFATNSTYTESAISFMTPPDLSMGKMVANKGRMILVHGVADPVFSANDTIDWYEKFKATHGSSATDFARLFLIPGMGHSRGGPSTDQTDLVDVLVNWVERGIAPDAVVARARGKGGAISPINEDVPVFWSANRSRILCPYPATPRYKGTGDSENAVNFFCTR